jgi:hypothetical protein
MEMSNTQCASVTQATNRVQENGNAGTGEKAGITSRMTQQP